MRGRLLLFALCAAVSMVATLAVGWLAVLRLAAAAWTPDAAGLQKLALPVLGMGIFLMTRKQLLGLKERVERHQAAGGAAPEMLPAAEPAPDAEETVTFA